MIRWHAQLLHRRLAVSTGVAAVMIGLMISLAARAQSSGTLELPEQIGQPQERRVSVENLEIVPAQLPKGQPDTIAPPNIPTEAGAMINPVVTTIDRSVAIRQSNGGRDLCAPDVAAWEREQAGVDCRPIDLGSASASNNRTTATAAADPLQSSGANDAFSTLGLGTAVPVTVILQQDARIDDPIILPVINQDGQVINDLLHEPGDPDPEDEETINVLGLGADIPATVILQK